MTRIYVLITLIALSPSSVFGQTTLVLPEGLENVEGNIASAFAYAIPAPMRMQTLYEAGSFPGPVIISQIAYRLDYVLPSTTSFTISDIQINFSTFAGTDLSTTYADNVGSDEKVVFDRGSLSVVLTAGGTTTDFDLVINLDHPFAYNPAAGNLLVDTMKYSTEFVAAENYDAQQTSTITSVSSYGDVTGTADIVGKWVEVTRFTLIPEPTSISVLLVGCTGLFMVCRPKN